MYISYNWLKELINIPYQPYELENILTMLGIEVESTEFMSKKYDGFVTALVVEKEKHPNADKLSVCKVENGTGIKTVVCGAPNVEKGQKVVLGNPGAVVPSTMITLENRNVRGVESEGMICSKAELGIGEDKDGIWVLSEDTNIGIPFSEYYFGNDIIMEIGVTPNRADCLSHIGIARELSAYMLVNGYDKTECKINYQIIDINENNEKIEELVSVEIKDKEKCPRYTARIIKNVKIGQSPEWVKKRLSLLGLRPINTAVDITNLVMYEYGQPLHAFDLNTVNGGKILVKTAKDNEKFTSLDGKERILDSEMLMICDAEKSIAIGGVMGGENTEITDRTTDILLESAYFSPESIRKTSKKLSIQSDSSYRFERGVDYNNTTVALDRAAEMIAKFTGGYIVKGKIDSYPEVISISSCKVRFKKAKQIIGVEIPDELILSILNALNFQVINKNENEVEVQIPSYRVDITKEIDVIEEIARLYNYDKITADFTSRVNFSSEGVPEKLSIPKLREEIRRYLIYNGFNEILTQNLIDPDSAKMFVESPIRISNPLGEELSVMRPSLVPSILKTIEWNNRFGTKNIHIFEIGKSFKIANDNNATFIEGINESEELVIGISGMNSPVHWDGKNQEVDFYEIKGIFSDLAKFLKLPQCSMVESNISNPVFNFNSMIIYSKEVEIGKLGSVSKELLKKYDVQNQVYLIILDLTKLYSIKIPKPTYNKVNPYPAIKRDLAFVVDKAMQAEKLSGIIAENGSELLTKMEIFDVFESETLGNNKKSIAFSLEFSSPEKTLEDSEIYALMDKIIKAAENKLNATIRK